MIPEGPMRLDSPTLERLVRTETLLLDIHRRLFGNGQPGEIEVIKQRLSVLEKWLWRITGFLGLATALMHGAEVIRSLFKQH
jgi:hypothetical protein